jgi:hypothetical protein
MPSADVSALAAALKARAPTPHARWLAEADEPALQALLRARYGETYAYQSFYRPDGLARLWREGSLLSLGEYDDAGLLVAHTGVLLRPGRDHAESGLSLIHPRRRSAMTRAEHAAMWQFVLSTLAGHVTYLHQYTSTLHPRAQRYAQRLMRATPAGLVVDYTTGERLVGIDSSDAPMQALAMTTVLRPPRRAGPRHLPGGPWFAWLEALFAGLDAASGAAPPCLAVPVDEAGGAGLAFDACDLNPALQLARRTAVGLGPSPPLASARVDLVHLPVADADLVARGAGALARARYVPVGVRPGDGGDAIVWQHLPDRAAARASAARAVLAGAAAKSLFQSWSELCARTS